MTKRRQISLLPLIHQTEPLSRFFNSTVDQLFQEGKTEPVSGFIGRRPERYNPDIDFYKPEPTSARERYQLEPAMVSTVDDTITSKLFYDDLLSLLGKEGSPIENPNRLFSSGYYSWAPPIDIDRIMNFQQYFWSGNETSSLEMIVPGVEIAAKYYADGASTIFTPPPSLPSRNTDEEDITVLVNGIKTTAWSLNDDSVVFNVAPDEGELIVIFRYGNIGDGIRNNFRIPDNTTEDADSSEIFVFINGRETLDFSIDGNDEVIINNPPPSNTHIMVTRTKSLSEFIIGKTSFDPSGYSNANVNELVDGMRVRVIDPINFTFGYDLKAYGHPWDELYSNTFFVEGVGIRINLLPTDDVTLAGEGHTADDPRYIVVARDDSARSYWSKINKWVHRSAFINPDDAKSENRAKRPILEFLSGIQQINYGNHRVQNVSGMISDTPIFDNQEIPFEQINGLPEGSLVIDNGFRPRRGDIIAVNLDNSPHNNTLLFVDVSEDNGETLFVFEPLVSVEEGAITSLGNKEYWFDGTQWNIVPVPQQFPMFDLFDNDGVSLSDEGIYPDNDFTGSKIFGFLKGSGRVDELLNLPLSYDEFGQIQFENELSSTDFNYRDGAINGYYYYKRNDKFENSWHKSTIESRQNIDDNNVSDIPLGLHANPDFETPAILSRNDWFNHFSSILENQDGFEGQAFSANNWNDTDKDVSRGLTIIQHEAPLLKLMAIMANDKFSIKDAVKFVSREYTQQKARILKHVYEISLERDIRLISSELILNEALQRANAIKTKNFPFADSTVGGNNYFIPLTPSVIGINPLYKPSMNQQYVMGHDGSKTPLFGDDRDRVLLVFENNIYNHVEFQKSGLEHSKIISGKYRSSLYSPEELAKTLLPSFEEWLRENALTLDNNTFDENDPFTWNYSQMVDRDGDCLHGHWRAIYRHYFDTDQPNIAPWEMLGFSVEPSWWVSEYGSVPYTRDNIKMWEDISEGKIIRGKRKGTYSEYIRNDLLQVLPIDKQGNIIDPFSATIILKKTPIQFAKMKWSLGDGSPVEEIWRNTSSYSYSLALAKFLLRPSTFVEFFWDIKNENIVHGNQLVQTPFNERINHSQFYVNGETNLQGDRQEALGIQNWITDNLIHKGLSPSLLGETVRGLSTQLGHKMAGFTTKDRMTISAESFGLVPDEDVDISLYNSPDYTEYFYSGIIIERVPQGWRIIGYNPNNPFFDIIAGDPNSRKVKVTIDGLPETPLIEWGSSVYYKVGQHVTYQNTVFECITAHTSSSSFEKRYWVIDSQLTSSTATTVLYHTKGGVSDRIEYGSVLPDLQSVADLIFGYARFLEDQGFIFGNDDENTGWRFAARTFLSWSQTTIQNGDFISLSPASREVKFKTDFGMALKLEEGIIGRDGLRLSLDNITIDRFEDTTVISSESDIYGARLQYVEVEHCLLFANQTIFNDTIFNPLYNIRQDRLKLSARRAGNWKGRYEADGFIINGNSIIPNFVKLGEDIREMFDIERADNTTLRDHARHVIGFERRDYLDRLLLNETQQFELYQGMIQQKGSSSALSAILRSDQIGRNRDVEFLEEWAFRIGKYGAYNPNITVEFSIKEPPRAAQRQVIHLRETDIGNWIDISNNWISEPANFADATVDKVSESLPTAGFARLDEVQYFLRDYTTFNDFSRANSLLEGDRIWITHTDDWDIVRLCYPTSDRSQILAVNVQEEDAAIIPDVLDFRITFDKIHNFKVDEYLILTGGNDDLNTGRHKIVRIGDNWVECETLSAIDYTGLSEDFSTTPLESPLVLRAETTRLSEEELPSYPYDELVYIGDRNQWCVKKKIAGAWVEQRRKGMRIENKNIVSSEVYSSAPKITGRNFHVEPSNPVPVSVYDPLSGLIGGAADAEIDFKLEYDPADYSIWGAEQVGTIWWDVSTSKFVECFTDAVEELPMDSSRYQNEIKYRSNQWGRLLPSSSVDIYQWSRTLTQPDFFSSYTTRIEYNPTFDKNQTVYYHWVLNPTTIPSNGRRKISANSIGELIKNPTVGGITWHAIIAPEALLLSGADILLDDDFSNYQIEIKATDYDGDEHAQWVLHRPQDKGISPPNSLWQKLIDSLREFDNNLNPVVSNGRSSIEENYSIFSSNILSAKQSFVTIINYILSRRDYSSLGIHMLSNEDKPIEELIWSDQSGLPPLAPNYPYDAIAYCYDDMINLLGSNQHVLLDNRMGDRPSWSIWTSGENGPIIATAYDKRYSDREDRDNDVLIQNGERVLVENDEEAEGFWTIWEKTSDGFDFIAAQRYRTNDFWELVDWFADGYSIEDDPVITYNSVIERTEREGPEPVNTLVRINSVNGWYWTFFNGEEWDIVARENGTIFLIDQFFTSTTKYDGTNIKDITDRDGSFEIAVLLDDLLSNSFITVEEQNEIWYSILHYIHTNSDLVDWAFKTSFINILNFNERMWQSPVTTLDNTQLLVDYIDEVKPYRVKLRELLRTSAPDLEEIPAIATDFDKPAFFDETTQSYRSLDEVNDSDILNQGVYRHYTNNPDQVRTFNINMIYDRIWAENVEGAGAIERIVNFYQPSDNMRANSVSELLGLDFKGTVYDGRSLQEIQNDVILRGGDENEVQVENDSLLLRDPAAQGRPEDLAKFGTNDGVVFTVHDKWGNGAPQHVVRQYDVSKRTKSTALLDVGLVADSIVVFRDGIRAEDTEYVYSQVANTVLVNLEDNGERVSTIAIHAFGFAAVDRILNQRIYQGGNHQYALPEAFTGFVEVFEDGVLLEGVNRNIDNITLPNTTSPDSTLLATHYSTENPRPIRQVVEKLEYVDAKTWQLDIVSERLPHHVEMIVEVNGCRLTPPKTYYSDGELSVYVNNVNLPDVMVYDDEGVAESVIDSATLTNADMNSEADVISFMGNNRYALWNNRVVFSDSNANARLYTVVVNDGDFWINDTGQLTINTELSSDDRIEVLSFTNSAKMEARTYVFDGASTGIYPIRTMKQGRAWMTINGKRLVENIDYEIIGSAGGAWDIDPFEAYAYDSFQSVQIAIKLPGITSSDRVVITTFEGRENNSAHSWQLSSTVPSDAWLVPDDDGVNLYVARNAWEIVSFDKERRAGKLSSELKAGDDTISLSLNPLGAPVSAIPSQPFSVPTKKTPGVVWINGERIEYFGYNRQNDIFTFTQLRRGTRGTSMMVHPSSSIVFAGDAILDRLPPCPSDEFTDKCCDRPDSDGLPPVINQDGDISGRIDIIAELQGSEN